MTTTRNHIILLCSRLDLPGGIERAVVNAANLFSRNGHRVTLVVLDETDKSFYPIDATIELVHQPLSFGITPDGNIISRKIKLLTDVLKLRKLLKQLQPSHIIATEYPFAAAVILSNARNFAKVYSWEHHHMQELKRNTFWNKILQLTFPRLDAIICLNEDEAQLFKSFNAHPVIIPNFIEKSVLSSLENKLILTVGRLTAVKGTDQLLHIAKEVLTCHPNWQWKLIGDGDMKEDVLKFIQQENLKGRLIVQPPISHDIEKEYQQASLYVMTSRHECFPMTLLEAQAAGMPCIAFDCDTGPRHIIKQNINGLLVEKENTTKMAKTISFLISDEALRKKMGETAYNDVQQFSPERIYELWQQLF